MTLFITFVIILFIFLYFRSKSETSQETTLSRQNAVKENSTSGDVKIIKENKKPKQTTYYFKLAGTNVGNREEIIQKTAKEYIKNGLIWGRYDGLTSKEMKELFPTEDDPIWEVSLLETIPIVLVREPNNKFDKTAISVQLKTGEKIGYIAQKDIDMVNSISNRIISVKAHIEGGKYKYVDYDEFGNDKLITGNTKYNFNIGVKCSTEFSTSQTYISIKNDPSSSSVTQFIQPKLLTELPSYVKARKYEDNYVVIDFETTGLKPEYNEIIQIGAIKYENDVEIERFNEYIKPMRSEISSFITEITGISNQQVKDAPTFSEKYPDLLEFISGYTLVAHNAQFDMGFLLFQLAENTADIPKFRTFDTLSPSKRKLDFLRDRKLETIKKFLDVDAKSHDALGDCLTTAALYKYLKKH